MKIILVTIGKFKNDYVKDGFNEYLKRIKKFCNFNLIELKEEKIENVNKSKTIHSEKILDLVNGKFFVLLDLTGKEYNSKDFSDFIYKNKEEEIYFVIGNFHGFSDELINKAKYKISFSKLTFPHQLIKLFFIEQLYRAFTIKKNIPYHK
ncbi:MAG: 23S rRNA (pseudouridine(1915)-N(3))-methyltransferase RlmH [Nanoarchaeota archaeon]